MSEKVVFQFETEVLPDWVDYNGHMRDAFYGLVFSFGIDAFMDAVGLDEAYRQETKGTIYTLEDHRFYIDEVKEGELVRVDSYILDSDHKRIHLLQNLMVGERLSAVCESMLIHISQMGDLPRSAPMPETVQATCKSAQLPQDEAAQIKNRASAIGIRRK